MTVAVEGVLEMLGRGTCFAPGIALGVLAGIGLSFLESMCGVST